MNKASILLAIELIDEKKREVCHTNLDAWFILFHAKQYLLAQIGGVILWFAPAVNP